MNSLIELNINLDRLASVQERQANALERLVELMEGWLRPLSLDEPDEPAGLEALSLVQRSQNKVVKDFSEDWKEYSPRGGKEE